MNLKTQKEKIVSVLILAFLATGLTLAYCRMEKVPVCGVGLIDDRVCGWPFWFKAATLSGSINAFLGVFFDFSFWFLLFGGILLAATFVLEKIKSKKSNLEGGEIND